MSSFNFVDAAGLRPQDRAFVGLRHSPADDGNYAGKERTHISLGFLHDRRTHHIDPQSLGKCEGGNPSETFQRARDGCTRGAPEDRVVVENARDQGEGSLSLMNGIASWTRLIWPMSLLPNENCQFSAVSCESGANTTSPAATATASNEPTA